MEEIQLLPEATQRRVNFLKLIEKFVTNSNLLTSNCIILEGNPGTGKTTLINQALSTLKDKGAIYDYHRVTGHITKTSVYSFLEPKPEANGKVEVHVFDDADILSDTGCLELLKSAFETRNLSMKVTPHDFRRVNYYTKGTSSGYIYTGYGIIITNQSPDAANNIHYKALLDRANKLKIEFGDDDLFVFNASVIQKELDANTLGWSDESIEQIAEFFQTYIRKWWNNKAFPKAKINFSLRLIHRFMDYIITFGPDFWKQYSDEFNKLETA
jgi:hypothetical protein